MCVCVCVCVCLCVCVITYMFWQHSGWTECPFKFIHVNNVGPIQTEPNLVWLDQSGRKLYHYNWQNFGDLPSDKTGLSAK